MSYGVDGSHAAESTMVDHIVNYGVPTPLLPWGVSPEIAARIKELREARNLTQDQVAAALKIRKQTVSSWENGRVKNLTLRNLFALADALDIEARWLALGHNDRLCSAIRGFSVTDTSRIRLRRLTRSDQK